MSGFLLDGTEKCRSVKVAHLPEGNSKYDEILFCKKNSISFEFCNQSIHRYEVFIIGPAGKRFRSRNELKTFFEKTGEKILNPEDFDFSTFGTGNTGRGGPPAQVRNGGGTKLYLLLKSSEC